MAISCRGCDSPLVKSSLYDTDCICDECAIAAMEWKTGFRDFAKLPWWPQQNTVHAYEGFFADSRWLVLIDEWLEAGSP